MLYNRPVIRPGNCTPSYTLLFPTGAGQEFATCVSRFTVLRGKSHAASPAHRHHRCVLAPAACFITVGEAIAVSMAVVPTVRKEQPALLCSPWSVPDAGFYLQSLLCSCRLSGESGPRCPMLPSPATPNPFKILLFCVFFHISSHLILRLFSSEDTAPWPQACQSISLSCDLY